MPECVLRHHYDGLAIDCLTTLYLLDNADHSGMGIDDVQLPHPRLIHLLDAVSTSPLTQDELAQRLNVSTRTIRTDVALLNNLMVNHGAHLIHQRGSGYQLNIYNQSNFEHFLSRVQKQRLFQELVKSALF